MSTAVAYPVRVLREHITELEAALSVCLADPSQKPVHKLRTQTRRVEALLLLIALVPGLPEHRKAAASLLRSLAKLRRAAGTVRDLDVHRAMLESLAGTDASHTTNGSAEQAQPRRSGGKRGTADTSALDLREPAKHLRKLMGDQREKAAAALQELLGKRQAKTAKASEHLLDVLAPAKDLSLPAQDLLRDAQSVLTRDGLLQTDGLASATKQDLHALRKSAKAARYVAESVSGDGAATEAARGFEALQEAGGQWHDSLELARAARRHFGKNHELTAAYQKERDGKLKAYRAALEARAKQGNPAPRSRSKNKAPSARKQPIGAHA